MRTPCGGQDKDVKNLTPGPSPHAERGEDCGGFSARAAEETGLFEDDAGSGSSTPNGPTRPAMVTIAIAATIAARTAGCPPRKIPRAALRRIRRPLISRASLLFSISRVAIPRTSDFLEFEATVNRGRANRRFRSYVVAFRATGQSSLRVLPVSARRAERARRGPTIYLRRGIAFGHAPRETNPAVKEWADDGDAHVPCRAGTGEPDGG